MIEQASKPDAANSAMTLRFHAADQWSGVAGPERSAACAL